MDFWTGTADDHCVDELAEERVGRDLDEGVHTVCRWDVSALTEVLDRKGLVRDCTEALVCEAQGWKSRRTGQVDDGGEDLIRHAGQREAIKAIRVFLGTVSVSVQSTDQKLYTPCLQRQSNSRLYDALRKMLL